MKTYKKLTVAVIMLFIASLILAAFFGVYILRNYKVKNIIPNYSLGMEFTKKTVADFEVDEDLSDEKKLTKENYSKIKERFIKKLKSSKVAQYIVKLDEETGKITVEIPENDDTNTILTNLADNGTFAIVDYETRETLLDQSNLLSANVAYNSDTNGTSVFLSMRF